MTEYVTDHAFTERESRTFNNGVTVRYCTCGRPEYSHITPPRELLRYVDQDGDMLAIHYDPQGDATEDIWIGVYRLSEDDEQYGPASAVRIPLGALRAALSEDIG